MGVPTDYQDVFRFMTIRNPDPVDADKHTLINLPELIANNEFPNLYSALIQALHHATDATDPNRPTEDQLLAMFERDPNQPPLPPPRDYWTLNLLLLESTPDKAIVSRLVGAANALRLLIDSEPVLDLVTFREHFTDDLQKQMGKRPYAEGMKSPSPSYLLRAVWSTYSYLLRKHPLSRQSIAYLADCIRVTTIYTDFLKILRPANVEDQARHVSSDLIRPYLFADIAIPEQLFRPKGDMVSIPIGDLGRLRSLGVADLKVVRQRLVKYDKGEIAHIENVLKAETKSRRHSRLERIEEFEETVEEDINENMRDSQTTDRSEIADEAQRTIQSDTRFHAGLTVTATNGPLTATANADYTSAVSRADCQKEARKYAKDVVSRTVDKISRNVRRTRSRKTFTEIQEANLHRIENTSGTHSIGMYRWIDKWYQSRVYNYGLRWMVEFFVPEPAAAYKYAVNSKLTATKHSASASRSTAVPDPQIDNAPLSDPSQIDESNYRQLLARFPGVAEVAALPPASQVEAMVVEVQANQDGSSTFASKSITLKIPSGFKAIRASVGPWDWWDVVGSPQLIEESRMIVKIGSSRLEIRKTTHFDTDPADIREFDIDPPSDTTTLPVTVVCLGTPGEGEKSSVHIAIEYERLPIAVEKWQNDIYAEVMKEFQAARAGTAFDPIAVGAMTTEFGSNPEANRMIEKIELKRLCLTLLRNSEPNFDDMVERNASMPKIADYDRAVRVGRSVQFFEQVFEWEQMTYLFYPYFWADRTLWEGMMTEANGDPVFQAFLAAGYARVVLPVRPAYSKCLMHYLATGEEWSGADGPIIGRADFVSIIESLKERDGAEEGVPEGDPWLVKVPTSLIMLDIDEPPRLPDFSVELGIASGRRNYVASQLACHGEHYDLSLWPEDGYAIHAEYAMLGYPLPDTGDPLTDMNTAEAISLIKQFQARAKVIKPELHVRRTGRNDACTLIALTFARQLRLASEWPGPVDIVPS